MQTNKRFDFPFSCSTVYFDSDPVYYLVHRLVGITLYCRLIIAWLIQMTPWPWWYSAHLQCLKMPSCLSWNRGASRGFLTPLTSVWDIVCPLLSYRSVQCIFINLVLKMGKADKYVLSIKWWFQMSVINFVLLRVFFLLFGLDRMRFSKMSLYVLHIQSIGNTRRTGFWSDMDMIRSGGYCSVFQRAEEHTVDALGGFVLSLNDPSYHARN